MFWPLIDRTEALCERHGSRRHIVARSFSRCYTRVTHRRENLTLNRSHAIKSTHIPVLMWDPDARRIRFAHQPWHRQQPVARYWILLLELEGSSFWETSLVPINQPASFPFFWDTTVARWRETDRSRNPPCQMRTSSPASRGEPFRS